MIKRRSFLKKIIVSGVGASLIPLGSFAVNNSNNIRIIKMPKPNFHIRHGNWKMKEQFAEGFPQWLKKYQHDVFFQNGISLGKNDLENISFEIENKKIAILFHNREVEIIADNQSVNGVFSFDSQNASIETVFYTIEPLLMNKYDEYKIETESSVCLIVLKGEAYVQNVVLNKKNSLSASNKNVRVNTYNEACLFLILKKKNL